MKDNKIDDLFKAGLSQNKLTPPPAAWDRIEAGLPAKSKKGAWFFLSIAASLTIILSLGWILISQQSGGSSIDDIQQAKVETKAPDTNTEVKDPTATQPKAAQPQFKLITPVNPVQNNDKLVASANKSPSVETKEVKEVLLGEIEQTRISIQPARLKSLNSKSVVMIEGFKMHPSDYQQSLQAFLSEQPSTIGERPSKKRFSLLGGIISVAKGVNNTKVGLSDLRKSKNEFIENELKYGENSEDSDEDEDAPFNK